VPTPNSYSRRSCSNSSTFDLLSTPRLLLVQQENGALQELWWEKFSSAK
jgi:hypothetical protein